MTNTKMLLALTLGVALAAGYVVEAQRRGGRRERSRIPAASTTLESVRSLKCSFSTATTAVWESGEVEAQAKKSPAPAVLMINNIDVQDGTAEIVSGFRGGDNVNVKLAGSTLHFLDMSLNGTLSVTTVFAKETHDGRLQAVYSRASYVENAFSGAGQPEMAQYYGDCEVGR